MEKILYDLMDWAGIEELVYSEALGRFYENGVVVAQEKRKPGWQIGNVTRETVRSRSYWDSAFWQLLHGGSLYV